MCVLILTLTSHSLLNIPYALPLTPSDVRRTYYFIIVLDVCSWLLSSCVITSCVLRSRVPLHTSHFFLLFIVFPLLFAYVLTSCFWLPTSDFVPRTHYSVLLIIFFVSSDFILSHHSLLTFYFLLRPTFWCWFIVLRSYALTSLFRFLTSHIVPLFSYILCLSSHCLLRVFFFPLPTSYCILLFTFFALRASHFLFSYACLRTPYFLRLPMLLLLLTLDVFCVVFRTYYFFLLVAYVLFIRVFLSHFLLLIPYFVPLYPCLLHKSGEAS